MGRDDRTRFPPQQAGRIKEEDRTGTVVAVNLGKLVESRTAQLAAATLEAMRFAPVALCDLRAARGRRGTR